MNKEQDSDFTKIIEAAGRRLFLKQSAAVGMGAFLATTPISTAIANSMKKSSLMGFEAIPASSLDEVIVPKGYKAEPLISWGDPIFTDAAEFDPSGKSPASAQEKQFGDNTDGMSFYKLDENRAVLAINNEYINTDLMFDHDGTTMTAENVKKSQAAHGVSIFEIVRDNSEWKVDKKGTLNRRITANTEMEMTGPAAGHDLLKTKADPTGKKILGTFSNCSNGQTPWGTYLTCEENFNGYFGADETTEISDEKKRYGIDTLDTRYQWSKHDERFHFGKNPNESNRHGWIVEIDPMDPTSTPLKRSALGRFKHENAAVMMNSDGHMVVYLGDDERGEHLYRFVSKNKYNPNDDAANRNLLEEGTLYVAKFNTTGTETKGFGFWLELTHGKNGLTKENGFADQADVLIHARLAATHVGATTMDRPEWVAIHPNKKMAYCTLTNNVDRGTQENQPIDGPNPREANKYGQIIRWEPIGGDHTATGFDWDLYLVAGNPVVHSDLNRGSDNITKDNMFNSPDGIGFDKAGRLWIQTDGDYSNIEGFAGMGNNQMLCGDPITGEIKRFLTGPIACEVTGQAFSDDYKTMFVGIQHPGEKGNPSHFPAGGESKPRSTVMMITREDGGIIGA